MSDPTAGLQVAVECILGDRQHLRVLEAGCGSRSYVRFPDGAHVVGIDISTEQLERNSGLNEKILGDIQSYVLPESYFDVVICWEVLEHIAAVRQTLINLFRSVKNDGIVILAAPNVYSAKGMITKITPYWFHSWFYHTFMRGVDATPFPTYLRLSSSANSVIKIAEAHSLSVEYFSIYESPWQRIIRERYGITGWVWDAIKWMCKALSLGRISADLTDFIVVLKKQPADPLPGVLLR